MAGDTSAELTIVVRAQDAATGVLKSMAGVIKRVLGVPLDFVWKSVSGILKQFFSLKSLLVGGGIIAVVRNITDSLAKGAKAFEPVFGGDAQRRIDDTASAFHRLGASLRATLGNLIAKSNLSEKLNEISDWLRDHQDDILSGFNKLQEGISWIINNAPKAYDAIRKVFRSSAEAFKEDYVDPWAPKDGQTALSDAQGAESRPTQAAATYNAEIVKAVEATDKLGDAATKTAKQLREEAMAMKAAVDIIEDYLTVGEAADIAARNMTDSFTDIVKGTKSVGQAFGEMVGKILEELGRLLVYRSLLNLFVNLGASVFGGSAGAGSGGAFLSESGFAGLTPSALASGGRVARGGMVRVGENGPEDAYLPAGTQVVPSQRTRDGGQGGTSVNVYGARDAKATALEVAAQIRRNARLRRAFA